MHTLKVTKYSSQGIALNETILIVDVEQDNMNAPKFEQLIYKLSISESTPVGELVWKYVKHIYRFYSNPN
jgi:hypothetical protein